jgi:uncharacterized membrane protein
MNVTATPPTGSSAATRLLERLVEGRRSLDGVAAALSPLAHRVRGHGPWRRLVTGEVVGHAAHPFLTDLPIGFWTSASLLDLVGGPGAEAAARRLVGAGLASAPAAALTGLAEYDGLTPRSRRVAAVHAALNVTSLGLYAASWAARPQRRRAGVALALAGLSVSGVSAYLGGHLAIGEKVGTTTLSGAATESAGPV